MEYIIFSLKHSTKKQPCFWRANNAGYTNYPFTAGHYTEAQIQSQPDYYNNGINSIAIPLCEDGMEAIGFKFQVDNKKVLELADMAEKRLSIKK